MNVGEPLAPAALAYGDRYQQLADGILNDPGGLSISDKTTCFNQKLMRGDHGSGPPSG